MQAEDFEIVREELEARLQAMTGLFDKKIFLRELHSLKGIAQAYGLKSFAEAVHILEEHVTDGAQPKALTSHLIALGRELNLSEAA